jgi:hypothetical protein
MGGYDHTSAERQRRYIARLKERAAGDKPTVSDGGERRIAELEAEVEQLKQAHLLLLNQKATKKLPRVAFRQILARLHPDSGGDAVLFATFKGMESEWRMTADDEAAKKRTEQSKEMWDKAFRDRQQKRWEQSQREKAAKAERKAKRKEKGQPKPPP